MRAMAALLCALVLALAVWCLTTWVRGTWAFVGLLVGLTPTLIYSTTLAAPNGLEMAAGVLLWSALLGLGRATGSATRCCAANAGCSPRRPCPSSCSRGFGRSVRCGWC